LRQLLEDYGFILKGSKATSHHTFRLKIDETVFQITVPYRRPFVNDVYVKDALRLIDQLIEMTEVDRTESGDEDDERS
jgi:hypothetical protein